MATQTTGPNFSALKRNQTDKVFQEHTTEVNFAALEVRLLAYADEVQVEENQECNHFNEPSRTQKNAW